MNSLMKRFLLRRWHDAANQNNSFLTSYINPAKAARVLDVGVDSGVMIIERLSKIKNPEIYGVDINDEEKISSL